MPFLSSFFATELLVIASDGVSLAVALVRQKGQTLHVLGYETAHASSLEVGLQQALSALRQTHKRLPKRAVALSAEVLPSLLDLPFMAGDNIASDKLQELLYWELAPFWTRHTRAWSLGSICLAAELITTAQLQQILEYQDTQRLQGQTCRWGEAAISLGLLQPQELSAALTVQQHLRQDEDTLSYGHVVLDHIPDQSLRAFATVTGQTRVDYWRDHCARVGLTLESLYPLFTQALPLTVTHQDAVLLEVYAGFLVKSHYDEQGMLQSLYIQHTLDLPSIDDCLALSAGSNTLYVAGTHHLPLLGALQAALGAVVQPPAQPPAPAFLAAMLRVASQHGQNKEPSCPAITVTTPRPAITKRLSFWLGSAIAAVFLFIVLIEATLSWQAARLQTQHDQLLDQADSLESSAEKVSEQSAEAKTLQLELTSLENSIAQAHAEYELLVTLVPQRAAFMQGFSGSLPQLVPADAVLSRVAETEQQQLIIDAWALSQSAAQSLKLNVTEYLDSFHLQLTSSAINAAPGPEQVAGYQVHLEFSPLVPKPKTPQKVTASAPLTAANGTPILANRE